MDSHVEQFVAALQTVNRHLRSTAFDSNRLPVTKVQWLLLRALHRRKRMTIGQLAEHLAVRASTMSQMLDRLEKAGLVARKQDESDARVKLITLTPAGEGVIEQGEGAWRDSLAEPFAHLSEEEKAALVKLMKRLAEHLPGKGEWDRCPPPNT
ncbi:MarR family transcriptional regulator [Paenibacillus sp.]|uniref:MarR family winged helix-turn-helix transcriptional regulator n=1 Tax=Paenibacillus sp. TaxID=58172 RepID=UPI002D4517AE|nr:MarR family transcriptional regulator [Paenibacillus sp.]HZG86402.1 MarR family transcriptional regulator [Paenibacillus sp.]